MSTSTNSYHAHDILNLLLESPAPFTITSLKDYIASHFGQDATFYTCKLKDLTIEQLLEFFITREKVIINGDYIQTNQANMCNH